MFSSKLLLMRSFLLLLIKVIAFKFFLIYCCIPIFFRCVGQDRWDKQM